MATIELCFDSPNAKIEANFDDLATVLESNPSLIWIDVDVKDSETLHQLADQLSLHKLDVESALLENERPQITVHEDTIFLEFYGLRRDGESLELDEISMFIGSNYLVTVRNDDSPSIDSVHTRWNAEGRKPGHVTAAMLLYALLDELVDDYFPIIDSLGDRIEELEDKLVEESVERPQLEILEIRKQILHLRRIISPQREVLNALIRRDVPLIDEHVIVYMADVYDHMLRILDWLESYRDMLTTLFDVQVAIQSHRLDRVIRTLTSSSIMLMVATLIAGIYGMNFRHMPELHWTLGYPLSLFMMIVSSVGLYVVFRRRDWI